MRDQLAAQFDPIVAADIRTHAATFKTVYMDAYKQSTKDVQAAFNQQIAEYIGGQLDALSGHIDREALAQADQTLQQIEQLT